MPTRQRLTSQSRARVRRGARSPSTSGVPTWHRSRAYVSTSRGGLVSWAPVLPDLAVDFAVSEIPFQNDEVAKLKASNKSYQYLPIVAGGTALMYNLKDSSGRQIRDLRLSASTIAGIFTGRITNWSDPAITADYGRPLPARASSQSFDPTAQEPRAVLCLPCPHESGRLEQVRGAQRIPNAATSNYPQFGSAASLEGI